MRRKRHRPIFVRNCDYCGTELKLNEPNSDSYLVTIEHKYFCKIHHVGEEPIKDCLEDYIRSKNVRKIEKEKEQRRLQGNSEKQPNEIKKEKEKISKKQKKIARVGGNKKRIDAADFRKLRNAKKKKKKKYRK